MRLFVFISFLFVCVTGNSQVFWSPVWMKESVRMTGLTGTGNYLYINAAGQISRTTGVGAGGVTGLNSTQILYGKSDGTIDQEAAFTYDESSNVLTITGTVGVSGYYTSDESTNSATLVNTGLSINSATGSLFIPTNLCNNVNFLISSTPLIYLKHLLLTIYHL